MPSKERNATWLLLAIISILSITLTHSVFTFVRVVYSSTADYSQLQPSGVVEADVLKYSLRDLDVPRYLPVKLAPPIRMTIEESVHYALTDPVSEDEWLYNSPYGAGAIRLGPDNRAFFVSAFHYMHCFRRIQYAFSSRGASPYHLQHCLNMLRESALCEADLTLEPGDFMQRNFTEQPVGETRVCRDWQPVYDELTRNWVKWYQFMKETNLTVPNAHLE
ncbi:hypothetical protein NEOLEDRAFT_1135974 [Neolentinus lepideus HHB14362 ss-1]|uniref:Oxidase ustYa n=1 Tax=Neolentinus lepideus HHB14362 ss-1 TaxID=1314782 RepID=A0A165RHM7_9AGAM|nr:hypothetical protein NEOLEDRAFT_1135974 [Neolentinus lepideus HHB14362 ss-1]